MSENSIDQKKIFYVFKVLVLKNLILKKGKSAKVHSEIPIFEFSIDMSQNVVVGLIGG